MRITDLHISGFGVWTDLSISEMSSRLTVFHGPNEAGKSTLMHFVRSVLYGFSPERRKYLPPLNGGDAGGSLWLESPSGAFRVNRTTTNYDARGPLGEVSIDSPEGNSQGQNLLQILLAGVDESTFSNVFAVGLQELQELHTLNDTEASDSLYKLASGVDRVSLVDVMRKLTQSRHDIFSATNADNKLHDLLQKRQTLQDEIDTLCARSGRWGQAAAHRRALETDIRGLQDKIREEEDEARVLEIALGVREDYQQSQTLSRELEEMPEQKRMPSGAVKKLEQLNEKIAQRKAKVEEIKKERARVRKESSDLPIDKALLGQAARIESLSEHLDWIDALETQVQQLQDETRALHKEADEQAEKMGVGLGKKHAKVPDLSRRTMIALRNPAKEIKDESIRLKQAEEQCESSKEEAEELAELLHAAVADRGYENIDSALAEGADKVSKLRKRRQIDTRIDELQRHEDDLEHEARELINRQVLPARETTLIGIPFVIGVMVMLYTFFYGVWSQGLTQENVIYLVVGGFLIVASVFFRLFIQRNATNDWEDCQRKLDGVRDQLGELEEERAAIDRRLPAGGGPLEQRLRVAEEDLTNMEELVPIETKRQEAQDRYETARREAADASACLKDARIRWKSTLRSVGLPETLQSKELRSLGEQYELLEQTRRRLETRQEDLQQRSSELSSLTSRINQIFAEVRLEPISDEPQSQLRQLQAVLNEQRKLLGRRDAIKKQYASLRRDIEKQVRAAAKLRAQRQAIIVKAGAEDEREYREFAVRQAHGDDLQRQIRELDHRLTASVGGHCSVDTVRELLDANDAATLEQNWQNMLNELRQSQHRLSELHQRRGELAQEMKTLLEDRRLDQARLEFGCVQRKLEKTCKNWRVLAVTDRLLESIRQIYETERQPETLSIASRHLAHLTAGKYDRLWTPLDEPALRVDDAEGNTLSLEVLSRGTREAIFLSLRLALATSYARRGALLPIVLDDVLVNLDYARLDRAAKTLCDFAANGHQVLIFTCHDHMVDIFRNHGADIRKLPANGSISSKIESSYVESELEIPRLPEPAPEPEPEPVAEIPEEGDEDLHLAPEEWVEPMEDIPEPDHHLVAAFFPQMPTEVWNVSLPPRKRKVAAEDTYELQPVLDSDPPTIYEDPFLVADDEPEPLPVSEIVPDPVEEEFALAPIDGWEPPEIHEDPFAVAEEFDFPKRELEPEVELETEPVPVWTDWLLMETQQEVPLSPPPPPALQEEEQEEQVAVATSRRRFTWESPEMWKEEEAA